MDEIQQNIFPRELSAFEKDLLFYVLPDKKPGYKLFKEGLFKLVVTGNGRFGPGNFILTQPGTIPDLSVPSAPVFALGTVEYQNNKADVVIHEETEEQVEFDITYEYELMEPVNEIKRWSYSDWIPGQKAPGDGTKVREIEIEEKKFLLAVAPEHKKIWLHIYETGVNMLIPVTNFYNYIMLVKNIRNAEIVFKPALFFNDLKNYSDTDIVSGFHAYNKYFKRIKLNT